MRGHHRFPGAGPAVHDGGIAEVGADDGFVIGLNPGEHIPQSAGPRVEQDQDERREVGGGGVGGYPVSITRGCPTAAGFRVSASS